MKFNIHGLAFKQSLMILVGITIVFGGVLGVMRYLSNEKLGEMLTKRSEEVSQANIVLFERIFNDAIAIGEAAVSTIETETMTPEEQGMFLRKALEEAMFRLPQVEAIVVAYEQGMAPNARANEYMRLAMREGDSIVVKDGHSYQEKLWYTSTKNKQKALWQEPFIGQFVPGPIAVYTIPIFKTDKAGEKKFAGVLCVDISLKFLNEALESIPIANSGFAFILSSGNFAIGAEGHREAGKNYRPQFFELEKNFRSRDQGLFVASVLDETDAVVYFRRMTVNGWTYMVVWPSQKFFEEQRSLGRTFIILSACGYILIIVILLLVSLRVTRPLVTLSNVADKLGQGDFDAEIPNLEGNDEISHFAAAFGKMRSSLQEYIQTQKGLERIESELGFARGIQMGMLPKSEMDEKMDDCRHKLAPFLLPAKEIGGDFYDFFKLDDNRLCVLIADVSGKGVPAALFMMAALIVVKTMIATLDSISDAFDSANQKMFLKNKLEMFVTVWAGILDLRTGQLHFASAGHNPPAILRKDGTTEFLKVKPGIAMAAMGDVHYTEHTAQLDPGDTLLLYTDGVTEATNAQNELFGDDRLLSSLAACNECDPEEVCARVKKDVDAFVGSAPQFDDITMLAVKFICGGTSISVKVFPKVENLERLTAFVEGVLGNTDTPMKTITQMDVAIDEVFSNIVSYSGATEVTLTIYIMDNPSAIKLTFVDDGKPYNPLEKDDPDVTLSAEERGVGGLGIFIVKKMMDSLEYERNGEKNQLTLTKIITKKV